MFIITTARYKETNKNATFFGTNVTPFRHLYVQPDTHLEADVNRMFPTRVPIVP